MGNTTRTIQVKINGSASGLSKAATEAYVALRKIGQDTSGLRKAQRDADALANSLDKQAKTAREKGSLLAGGLALGVSAGAPLVSAALIGGVSLGFVGMAALVQKNNVKVVDSFSNLKNQVVTEMKGTTNQVVPYLVASSRSLQQTFANLGPQLDEAFKFAGPDLKILTTGVENFATNAMPGFVNSMRNSKPVVEGISSVLGSLGTTTTTLLDDVSAHSQVFGRDLTQFGVLIENVGSTVGAVLPGLASGFGTTVGTANTVLSALKPIAPALGTITGQVLPTIGALNLLGRVTGPLQSLGATIVRTGAQFGINTAVMTGNAAAGERVTRATSAVGKAVGAAGSALPIMGAAFTAVSTIIADSDQKFQQWQGDIIAGGPQATQAFSDFRQQVGFMPGAFQKMLDGLTPLQRAQFDYNALLSTGKSTSGQLAGAQRNLAVQNTKAADAQNKVALATGQAITPQVALSRAQTDYNTAISTFGANSPQAVKAAGQLATATDQDAAASERDARAKETLSEKLQDATNATLGLLGAQDSLKSAQLGVTQAQSDYNAAVKKSGPNSVAAQQALLGLNEAFKTDITNAGDAAKAVDDKAKADGQSISPSREAADVNRAQTTEVNRLINKYAASGQAIPASLRQIAKGMHDTGAQAAETSGDIQHVTNTLAKVPPGKKVTVNALTQAAVTELTNLGVKVKRLPDGKFSVVANTKAARDAIANFVRAESGKTIFIPVKGVVSPVNGKALLGPFPTHRAGGGPVRAGMPYIVGEHRPELFIPDRDGHVAPSVPDAGIGGWTGDIVLPIDLGSGVQQVIRISNRDLVRAVKARSKIR